MRPGADALSSRQEVAMHGSDALAPELESLTRDFAFCERVRHDRDPAYDGLIFIGVTSTRIYCRPVCPVRQPLSKNVRYYPSASAAEGAGFRPCLRCRPETAPHSPAWMGVRATVGRALRLIEDGALDEADVTTLAERLGIGPRHLSRLFRVHLGATPSKVARTARVQRAKRLIDGTALSMTEIAGLAGFSSLRSFNAAFREIYRRAPTDIRRGANAKAAG
jgi:AraC family transcriptional regulator of adaptative response / DNA-3-methyladenine glycosylase II